MPFHDKRVMVLTAHCDDEVCCAGTLHRLVRQGCKLYVIAFATAALQTDRQGNGFNETNKLEWIQSLGRIGVESMWHMDIRPSSDFQPHRQRICQRIFDEVESFKPDVVFTLSPEDENTAHAIVGVESERVMRGRVPTVIRCQFPWNYGIGRPNLYVKLSEEDLACKRAVINAYQSQLWRYQYEEMLLGYARADGLSVKCEYAERFEIIRSVQ